MYLVRGNDNREYGPVDAATVRRWAAERRLLPGSLVRAAAATDWSTLESLPEFADLKAHRPAAPPPMTSPTPKAGGKTAPISALAITSLALGVMGVCSVGLTAVAGLGLGIAALVRIRRSGGRLQGRGLAIAGVCVSIGCLVLAAGVLTLVVPQAVRAQQAAQQNLQHNTQLNACVNNLRQIDGAKEQWALAENRQPGDSPGWSDLVGTDKFIAEQPKCPAGGNYTIGTIVELPTCSIPEHTMKPNYRYRGRR